MPSVYGKLSREERVNVIFLFFQSEKNYSQFEHAWLSQYDRDPPCRQTVSKLVRKFTTTGRVDDAHRSGRPRSARSEERIMEVAQQYAITPRLSLTDGAAILDISKKSLQRILRQDLKFRPFTVRQLCKN